MIRTLPPAKPPLYFVPGEMNDRRAAVDVVRWKCRVAQRCEKRAHLTLGQFFSGLDCRFAGDGGGEAFMLGRRTGDPVAGQCVERLAQTTLGVEARMRHWNGIDDERMPAESFDLESQPLEVLAIRIERLPFRRSKMERQRQEPPLCGPWPRFQTSDELFVQDKLVSRGVVDEDQA